MAISFDLTAHDAQFHPDGYVKGKSKCKFRDEMKNYESVDDLSKAQGITDALEDMEVLESLMDAAPDDGVRKTHEWQMKKIRAELAKLIGRNNVELQIDEETPFGSGLGGCVPASECGGSGGTTIALQQGGLGQQAHDNKGVGTTSPRQQVGGGAVGHSSGVLSAKAAARLQGMVGRAGATQGQVAAYNAMLQRGGGSGGVAVGGGVGGNQTSNAGNSVSQSTGRSRPVATGASPTIATGVAAAGGKHGKALARLKALAQRNGATASQKSAYQSMVNRFGGSAN